MTEEGLQASREHRAFGGFSLGAVTTWYQFIYNLDYIKSVSYTHLDVYKRQTENIAEHLVSILDADLYEIVPQVPYTFEDLDYSNSDCRANREQNDPTARPAISGGVEDLEDYEVIFLGYPIWSGDAPKIIPTFLERCV